MKNGKGGRGGVREGTSLALNLFDLMCPCPGTPCIGELGVFCKPWVDLTTLTLNVPVLHIVTNIFFVRFILRGKIGMMRKR